MAAVLRYTPARLVRVQSTKGLLAGRPRLTVLAQDLGLVLGRDRHCVKRFSGLSFGLNERNNPKRCFSKAQSVFRFREAGATIRSGVFQKRNLFLDFAKLAQQSEAVFFKIAICF